MGQRMPNFVDICRKVPRHKTLVRLHGIFLWLWWWFLVETLTMVAWREEPSYWLELVTQKKGSKKSRKLSFHATLERAIQ